MLPSVLSRSLDEFHVFRLDVVAQNTGAELGDIAAPTTAVAATPASGPGPVNVEAEMLADGIWFLAGQSHHSVLVEFDDHLVIIEAPSEARTLGVIEKARELVPGKPVTHLVSTHHHFDHSGGIRAAVSEGMTIVTQAANEAFYRRMAAQPATIMPDAQARAQQPISITSFDVRFVHEVDSM